MPVALAGNVPASFEIKSASLPLVALLLKSSDLGLLEREMAARFGDIPDFFDDDALIIDLAPIKAEQPEAVLDFDALLPLLRQHRLRPLSVRGGSPAQMEAAIKVGLVPTAEAIVPRRPPVAETAPPPRPQSQAEVVVASAPSPVSADAAVPPAEPAQAPLSALVIDRPVRSGQQVYARGRDLVVMAMVNPGAEVIADGHIHVYAPLRGRAIAGARGDQHARIFALEMNPELISIAGVYRTTDSPLAPEVWGRAAQIHLASDDGADKLIVTAISG
ncbi:septum site-determining protein MinC [Ottowia thiooxydans]|uniref:Probable septum site-determining protein MinC n=1 Tax=Ottowia thiooxydans TaxID=219182 RepID=A0ABV2Q8H7_9BURK